MTIPAEKLPVEGVNPNPQKVETPNPPKQGTEPQKDEKVPPANPSNDDAFKKLREENETLKRQYKSSTEEALRLKGENETLKKLAEDAKAKPQKNETDADFQRIMEEEGLEAAIDHKIAQRTKPLQNVVAEITVEKSRKIYDAFKASHVGLQNPDVEAKFDAEFDKLKDVYDLSIAMEKAYVLAGGREAEAQPKDKVEDPKRKETETEIVKNVAGGEDDKRPVPATDTSIEGIQRKINDLVYQAAILSNQGRISEASQLYVRIDELKSQLGERS